MPIQTSFAKAVDRLSRSWLLSNKEKEFLPKAVGDVLSAFSKAASKQQVQEVDDISTDAAACLIRASLLKRGTVVTARKQTGNAILSNLLSIAFKVEAADTGQGTAIDNDPFPNTKGLYTSQVTTLVNMAIGDEDHAIAVYDAMLKALDPDDPNRGVLEELKFDEQVHERVLLRMLGNELPVLETPPTLVEAESEYESSYKKLEERGDFYSSFTDLVNMAIGDERHAIATYSAILQMLDPVDLNTPAIDKIKSDEKDHEKKLLRMLGEKTPAPVEM